MKTVHMLHNNQRGISQFTALVLIISVALFLFILGLFFRSDNNVGTGIEYSDPSGPAIIQESTDLYKKLGSETKFNLIRTDLTAFAKAGIEPYKQGDKAVIFKVTSTVKDENETISFEGKFEDSKDTIQVTIRSLKNERIEATIKNTQSGFTMKDELPSSNQRNKLITSLPIGNDDFTIEYLIISDSFVLNIFPSEPQEIEPFLDAAREELRTRLGVDSLDGEKVQIVTAGGFEYRSQNMPVDGSITETVN